MTEKSRWRTPVIRIAVNWLVQHMIPNAEVQGANETYRVPFCKTVPPQERLHLWAFCNLDKRSGPSNGLIHWPVPCDLLLNLCNGLNDQFRFYYFQCLHCIWKWTWLGCESSSLNSGFCVFREKSSLTVLTVRLLIFSFTTGAKFRQGHALGHAVTFYSTLHHMASFPKQASSGNCVLDWAE